jgi:signal peptidase
MTIIPAAAHPSLSLRPRLKAALRFAGTVLATVLLGLVISAGAALVVVPRLTGSVPLTVLTGSMTPTYPPGTVVVVRPTPADQLNIGDAVTYQVRSGDPAVVTHRIVGIAVTADGKRLFTFRGDANTGNDPAPVRPVQIRGRVWYSVPYVGYASTLLSPAAHQVAIRVLAGGLLAYAGFVMAGAGVDRLRRRK